MSRHHHSEETVHAVVQNAVLAEMAAAQLTVWEKKLELAQAEKTAYFEDAIATIIKTKKTFWTRRTRTRDEAIAYFHEHNSWDWAYQDLGHAVRRAENTISRLKQITKLAEESNFENITLPERDLRLVGGHAE